MVFGAYLMNVQKAFTNEQGAWVLPFKAILNEPGSRLMLGAAILYSVTSVLGKKALDYVPASFLGPFYFVLLGIVTVLVFSLREPRAVKVLARHPGPQLVVGFAMAAMIVTHYLAIQQVEVAYMIAVKRCSLLFGILYGVLLFKETHLVQHLVAGAVMIIGVVLIAGS